MTEFLSGVAERTLFAFIWRPRFGLRNSESESLLEADKKDPYAVHFFLIFPNFDLSKTSHPYKETTVD